MSRTRYLSVIDVYQDMLYTFVCEINMNRFWIIWPLSCPVLYLVGAIYNLCAYSALLFPNVNNNVIFIVLFANIGKLHVYNNR